MGKVDIDLESVISFCSQFEHTYLSELRTNAQRLKVASASAKETLGQTDMSTRSAEKLEIIANAILKATEVGEQRILELVKKARRELDEKNRISGMMR